MQSRYCVRAALQQRPNRRRASSVRALHVRCSLCLGAGETRSSGSDCAKIKRAVRNAIEILCSCGLATTHLVLPLKNGPPAAARALNFLHDRWSSPIVRSYAGVVCRKMGGQTTLGATHTMAIQHVCRALWTAVRPTHLRSVLLLATRHRKHQAEHPSATSQPELGVEAANKCPHGGISG